MIKKNMAVYITIALIMIIYFGIVFCSYFYQSHSQDQYMIPEGPVIITAEATQSRKKLPLSGLTP